MIVDYECFECGYKGDAVECDRQIICPGCRTVNDIWLESEEPPERHKTMYGSSRVGATT